MKNIKSKFSNFIFLVAFASLPENDLAEREFELLYRRNPRLAYSMPCIPPTTDIKRFKISSTYGMRQHPISGTYKHHNGIDIAVRNAPVIATGSGIVSKVSSSESLGNYIEIQHINSYKSIYGHLSSIFVEKGQSVSISDTIAVSGSTGKVTGEHIHYEIKKSNSYKNPLYYLLLLYVHLHS